MATYTDAILVYNNGKLQKISPTDNIGVSGDVYIGGDLNVQGDIVSTGSTNALISDAFFDLSAGNTNTANARPGGLTINVKASGTSENISAFTAGVALTSAPTLTMTATSSFAAGDIIQISGATVDVTNNGLFIVASAVGSTVTLYGVGGTAVPAYAIFCQNQVVTGTMSAVATKVDLALLAVSDGVSIKNSSGVAIAAGKLARAYYPAATLANFNGTGPGTGFTELGDSTVSTTLQNAYEGGNTIGLSTTHGDLVVSVNTGTAAIQLDANAASHFTVDSAALVLSTTTSGNLDLAAAGVLHLDGAGGIEMNSVGASTIQIGNDSNSGAISIGNGPAARNVTVGNATGATTVTVNTGTGGLDVNALGAVTVDTTTAAISLDAVGARSNFTVTNERLDLKSVGSFATGNQVLIESTNSTGTSQVIAQADSNVVLQAPTVSPYLYFLADADASTKFVAMEADNNSAGIYIGSEPYNSFIAIGTDGSRIIDIGNTNTATAVTLYAQAGVSVQGTLTGNNYFRTGQYATGSLPTGAAGALIYDSTVNQPKWHNGTAWQTFGSLSASTLQQAYEGGNTISLAAAEGDLAISVGSGSAAVTIDTNKASWFKATGAALSLQTVTSGALDLTSAGALDIDAVGALQINSSGGAISLGNDAVSQAVNLGTGGTRTVSIGSSNATVGITGGSGRVTLTSSNEVDVVMTDTSGNKANLALFTSGGSGKPSIALIEGDRSTGTYVGGLIGSTSESFGNANGVSIGTPGRDIGFRNINTNTLLAKLTAAGVFQSNQGSGSDAIYFANNGARLHLGTGASDYFDSNGTRIRTPGAFTSDSYVQVGRLATGSLPAATQGGFIYDTTVGQPKWSDGSTWQTFGSLASATTLQGAYNASSPATITLSSSKNFTIAAPVSGTAGFVLGGNATSSIGTTGNNDILISSGGRVDISAATTEVTIYGPQVQIYGSGAGGISIYTSGQPIKIGTDANTSPIQIGTVAARTITIGNSTGGTSVTIAAADGVSVTGTLTGSSYLRTAQLVTSSLPSASGVKGALIYDTTLDQPVYSDGTDWLSYVTQSQTFKLNAASSSGIVKGNIIYIAATSGNAGLADNNDSAAYEPVAVAAENAPGGGGLFRVQAAVGMPLYMKFTIGGAPSGSGDIGKVVYLSDTAGEATLTAPSASGSRVYRMGILKSSTAVSGLYEVVYLPAFIADL